MEKLVQLPKIMQLNTWPKVLLTAGILRYTTFPIYLLASVGNSTLANISHDIIILLWDARHGKKERWHNT